MASRVSRVGSDFSVFLAAAALPPATSPSPPRQSTTGQTEGWRIMERGRGRLWWWDGESGDPEPECRCDRRNSCGSQPRPGCTSSQPPHFLSRKRLPLPSPCEAETQEPNRAL